MVMVTKGTCSTFAAVYSDLIFKFTIKLNSADFSTLLWPSHPRIICHSSQRP
jgi:hypothetical protein